MSKQKSEPIHHFPSTLKEIEEKINIDSPEKINEFLNYSAGLLQSEEERQKIIEAKATTLTGISGLASSVIFGFVGFIYDKVRFLDKFVLFLVTVFYLALAFYLAKSIYYSIMALKPGQYTYPDANDIFSLSNKSIDDVRKERGISFFYSYVKNIDVNNKKGTLLINAQNSFRNSIILLTAIGFIIGFHIFAPGLTSLILKFFSCLLATLHENL